MKTIRITAITLSIAAGIFLGSGCNKSDNTGTVVEPSKKGEVSAEKNSFHEVTSKLDAGGNLYAYLSTEQWLTGLSQKVEGWRGIADSIPDMKPEDRQNVGKVFDVVTSLIQKSGVEDISGVGISSLEREQGFYRTKFVLHHYPGKGTGFLWTMFGKAPHALDAQDLLPASTAFATFSDLDLPMLWSVVEEEIGNAGIPGAKEQLQKLPDQFTAATGLQLDKVLASLGNEYGLVITLDDTRKISIPLGDAPLQVPEPGVMLVIKVKDDTIFNRVDEVLKVNKQVVSTDKDGLRMRTMAIPLPLPISLRPSIARSGDYLFIATTDTLIEEAVAVKSGKKPGLKSTEEFKRLAAGIPTQGNQFSFMSQRFGLTWKEIQEQLVEKQAQANAGQADFMKKLMSLNDHMVYTYSVSANTDEGWLAVGNGNQNPAKMVLLPAVAVPAIAAGVALPALAKAKEKAQRINCISNLKQIELAKKMWADDNNKSAADVPTWVDLKQYLGKTKGGRLTCPSGGMYRLNAVSQPPTCSHPGHALRQQEE